MAASEVLKKRVADGKKKEKEEQKKVTASAFLQNRAKGSRETPLSNAGARLIYQPDAYGITQAPKGPASSVGTVSRSNADRARIFADLLANSPLMGGTINPPIPALLHMPSIAQMKAWVNKKEPNVAINLDNKPIQSHVTVNPTLVTATKKAEPQRSTAKNRKTMLYETNDSLLSPQEIVDKYRYVAEDTEMDAYTRNLAATKGLAATGRLRGQNLFGGGLSAEQMQAITALQGDLTYMTKASARGTGFGDAFGLNYIGDKLADIYVNKSGNAQLASEVAKRKELRAQTAAANPLSVAGGRILGEGIKYAAFSPIIEKQVAKGAAALGKDTLSKGARFATKLAGHQAADTALYTPTVVLEGLEANKSKKDIAMDVAKQQALDFGINLGFGAVAAGGKAVNSIRKTKQEQADLMNQVLQSLKGEMPSNQLIVIGETPEILKKYGMKEGKLFTYQSVLRKIAYPAEYRQALAKGTEIPEQAMKSIQGHNLGFEAIRRLPVELKDPVAILESATQDKSIIVLTKMIDPYKQPVVIPVRIKDSGVAEIVNDIPTMYGRNDFKNFMERERRAGRVLYQKNNKSLQQLPNNGLQLPESFAEADPVFMVARRTGKVKERELKNIGIGRKLEAAEEALRKKGK